LKKICEMKFYFTILFFFCLLVMTAQDLDDFEIEKMNIEWLEQKLEKGQIIKSKRKILKAEYDESNKVLYLITYDGKRKNPKIYGGLTALDLRSGEPLWSRPFHTKDDGFLLIDTIPIVFMGSSTWALNWKTEEKIWRVKCQLVSSTSDNSIAIGFAPDYEEQYKLMGVDVHSGNELWSRKLKRDQQIRSVKFLSDTAWISNSKGLDYTDVRNGNGFFHKTKLFEEEKLDRKQAAGVFVGAFFLGFIGGALGYIAVPIPLKAEANTLQTQSPIAINDGYFYGIDAKNVFKLNLDGEVIWETEFASDWREPDKIFVRSDKVFVVKDGYVLHPSEYRPEGIAGVQKYNAQNGSLDKQLTFNEPVEDYIIKDSTIVLVLTTKVLKLTLYDFSVIKETAFKNGERLRYGFDKILNPPLYIFSNGQFLNSEAYFKNYIYVLDKDGNKFEFNENFDLNRRMNPYHVYELSRFLTEDQFIISNGSRNVWVKSDGEKVLPFSFSRSLEVKKIRLWI